MRCKACDQELEPALPNEPEPTEYQFDNALWITLDGGYGMFIDPFGEQEQEYRVVICHACAHALCEAVPWIDKLVNPMRSHSHRAADIPRLEAEGHRGHDLFDSELEDSFLSYEWEKGIEHGEQWALDAPLGRVDE